MQFNIEIKRIYDPFSVDDGKRILIDRLWPRGISKDKVQIDQWMKDIAISSELRKKFNHKPEIFDDFKKEYMSELIEDIKKREKVEELLSVLKNEKITLLYGAKDREHNHAIVLREYLLQETVDK
ncbi:DUF488 domain-containing protein [Fredinandcohnia humi]